MHQPCDVPHTGRRSAPGPTFRSAATHASHYASHTLSVSEILADNFENVMVTYASIFTGPQAQIPFVTISTRVGPGSRLACCYYYLRVLYFANFCDLEKIAKLSTRKNFYQHIRHSDTIKTCCFLLWNMHNRALLSVSAFSFFPSRAVTSSRKWRLMTSMIVAVSRAKLKLCSYRIMPWVHAAPCGMVHVNSRRLHEHVTYYCITSQQLQSSHCDIYYKASRFQSWAFYVYLWLRESQNLARLREIAKFSTRNIVGIPKSQNFVLANNSNNKVPEEGPSFVNSGLKRRFQ